MSIFNSAFGGGEGGTGGGTGGGPGDKNVNGDWDASTNNPDLTTLSPVDGETYYVAVGGTQDLGAGNITFDAGDYVRWSDTASAWSRLEGPVNSTEVSDSSQLGGATVKESLDRVLGGSLELNGSNKAIVQADSNFIVGSAIDDNDLTDNTGSPIFWDQVVAITGWTLSAISGINDNGIATSNGWSIRLTETQEVADKDLYIAIDFGNVADVEVRDSLANVVAVFTLLASINGFQVGKVTIPASTNYDRIIIASGGSGASIRLGLTNPITQGQLQLSAGVQASLALADSAVQQDNSPQLDSVILNEIATPTPTANKGRMWTETDDLIHFFNGAGDELTLGTEQFVSVPASSSATGTKGQRAYSAGYMYECIATDNWIKYAVITSF